MTTTVGSPPVPEVMGIRCFAGRLGDAADQVVARALARRGGYVVLCNVHVLMTAQDKPEVRKALDEAWLVLPDGAPVAWLQRRLGVEAAERVPGPDLMPLVLDRGRAVGLRHVLLGSTEETLRVLGTRLRAEFPGVAIVGSLAPPVGDPADWSEEMIDVVTALEPQVVWVALGAPKQEIWMREHAAALAPAVCLGVGAAFDFNAVTKKRAPAWMRRSGLEWLHRFAAEPLRLAPRYTSTNARFVLRLTRDFLLRPATNLPLSPR